MIKIIKNTIWQGLGKIVVMLAGLITTSLLVRNLGESQYGLFSLIGSSFLVIDALSDLGTKIIGVREISKTDDKKRIFKNLLILRLVLTIIGLAIGLIFVFNYPTFKGYEKEAMVALSMSFLTFLAGNLEIIFQAEEKMAKKSLIDGLFPLTFLGLYLILPIKTTVLTVFGLYIVARILSLIMGVKIGFKRQWWASETKIDKQIIYKLFRSSWPMGLFLFLFTVYDRAVDSIIIDRFLGTSQVAWYSLAYKVYGNLIMPAYFLVTSAFPSLSREADQGGKKTYGKIMMISVGMSLIIWPIVWLMAPIIMKILAGSDFNWQTSSQILRILSLGLVFSFVNHVKGFSLISRNGERKMLVLGMISLIFNLGANLIVIPIYGVIGAAWVTTVTEILMAGIYLVLEEKA